MTTKAEPLLCRCFRVPERAVREAIARGLNTVEQIRDATEASSGCGSCYDDIQALLGTPAAAAAPVRLSDAQVRVIVRDVVDRMNLDGVRIVFEGMDGTVVRARVTAPGGDTSRPEVLGIKRRFLERLSDALGTRVTLLELNVVEEWESQ